MQGQLDLDEDVQGRVISVVPPMSAALVLLGAGALTLYAAINMDGLGSHLLFFAVAVGLLTVGIFALALRIHLRTPKEQAEIIFDAIHAKDPSPALISDERGVFLRGNRALMDALEGRDTDDTAASLLAFTTDGPSIVYRLLRALLENRKAAEMFRATDGTDKRITATRCNDQNIIWSIEDVVQADCDSGQLAALRSIPLVTMDPAGAVRSANPAAQAIAGGMPRSLADLVEEEDIGPGRVLHLKDDGHSRVRLVQSELEDGFTETLLLPLETDEVIGTSPEHYFDSLPVAIARISESGEIIFANGAAIDLLGSGAAPGVKFSSLMEGLGRSIDERIAAMVSGRSHMRSEMARAKVQGQEAFLQVTLKRLRVNGDTSLLAVISDETEQKKLENQFVQSQKMNAVGQLAGGVAHDFNNLLTAINGHCDLLLMRHEATDSDYSDLIQIRQNANRAASLVGQLLAFSRKQTLLPKVIDLYDTLSELNHLLNRLLGEKVTLRIDAPQDLPNVRVDERQLEQVIMNLVVNARDAMPDGGEVEIKARKVTFKKDLERDSAVVPFGDYVEIDVSDTGKGIPANQITEIFQPFYTTKKVGEGTGLGLSTAYGIIKQTGGFIFAQSTVGVGTTFTVYLPALSEEVRVEKAPSIEDIPAQDLTGRGVVLLVEDEMPVRSFAARALNIRGYTVLEAASAEEALDILDDPDLHVDVFVSDVIMPGMDGPTWVRKAQETRPDTRVVFVSGYAEDVFEGGKNQIPNATFLPKPFSLNELTLCVKEQLSPHLLN